MTLQNLVELVKDLFPNMGEPRILKEIDIAQKEFCNETKILLNRGELTDLTNTAWLLPDDFLRLKEVQAYDSNGNWVDLFNEGIAYELDLIGIYFYSTTGTALDSMPSTISSMYITYYAKSADVTLVTDTLSISDEYYLALEAFVLSRMYSRYPVSTIIKNEKFEQVDRQMAIFHKNTYKEYVRTAKKNRFRDDTIAEAIYYPGAGKYTLPKKKEFASVTTVTSLSGLGLIYSKYHSFTATSPSTITTLSNYKFTTISISVVAGVIVITSAGEFPSTIEYKDNQSNNYTQVSDSRIEVYPLSDWGTLQGRIYISL